MIDEARQLLGVAVMVAYGFGMSFWCIIHPWARFWRRLGPAKTYTIVGAFLATLGVVAYRARAVLLGRDLGMRPVPLALGVLLLGAMLWLSAKYGMGTEHLSARTRAGLPELSLSQGPGRLVRGGLYRYVRHPIYASAAAFGIAISLIVDHVGTYVLFVAAIPILYGITLIEERELIERFGEEYREYRRQVPRFVPRRRRHACNYPDACQ